MKNTYNGVIGFVITDIRQNGGGLIYLRQPVAQNTYKQIGIYPAREIFHTRSALKFFQSGLQLKCKITPWLIYIAFFTFKTGL